MTRRLLLSAFLGFITLLACSSSPNFSGRVVGVRDGDTIEVMHRGVSVRIRLFGIDTPEYKQPFGTAAKKFTSSLAFHKLVTVHPVDRDVYGRVVAEVFLPDGRSLNRELVREGMAWWYQHYAPEDRDLENLEKKARAMKKGLWTDSHPTAPWEWRRAHRNTEDTPVTDATLVYRTPNGKAYHRKDCPTIHGKGRPLSLGEARKVLKPCRVCKAPL